MGVQFDLSESPGSATQLCLGRIVLEYTHKGLDCIPSPGLPGCPDTFEIDEDALLFRNSANPVCGLS